MVIWSQRKELAKSGEEGDNIVVLQSMGINMSLSLQIIMILCPSTLPLSASGITWTSGERIPHQGRIIIDIHGTLE